MACMPDEAAYYTCPHCQHRLHVPPELRGQMVQCPKCEKPFAAPAAAGTATPEPPAPASSPSLSIPAVVLLLLGLWGLYACAISLAATVLKADQIRADFAERIAQARGDQGLQIPDLDGLLLIRGFLAILTALSLLTAAGAIAMLRRRGYWLAVVGCLAAFVNATPLVSKLLFCLPALPFAVWGLVALARPSVRAAFRRPSGT
jgi:hypothetical protein